MKTFTFIFTLLISSSAFAGFKTVAEAEKKLSAYTVADIKGDVDRLAAGKPLKIDEVFEDLQATVDMLAKNKITEDLALEMERACLLASLHDPSNYAIEIILPVFIKNKTVFEKAAESLHPTDFKNVMEPMRAAAISALAGDN